MGVPGNRHSRFFSKHWKMKVAFFSMSGKMEAKFSKPWKFMTLQALKEFL